MGRTKVRVLAAVAIAALVMSLAGCGSGDTVKIDEKNAGDKVTLAVGQQMEITLASNPTTGLSWDVADDAGIVKLIGEPSYIQDPGPTGMVGRGGAERLTFEATKSGSGTLVLEYRRPVKKRVEPEKSFEVPVEVR